MLKVPGTLRKILSGQKKGIVTIGSDSENKIVLQDKAVSKKHCLIFKKGDDWLISDLKSKNKTFVIFSDDTEKRATNKSPLVLEKGCQIIVGETILKVI